MAFCHFEREFWLLKHLIGKLSSRYFSVLNHNGEKSMQSPFQRDLRLASTKLWARQRFSSAKEYLACDWLFESVGIEPPATLQVCCILGSRVQSAGMCS